MAKAKSKAKSKSQSNWLTKNVSPQTFGVTLFSLFFAMVGLVYVVATYAQSAA